MADDDYVDDPGGLDPYHSDDPGDLDDPDNPDGYAARYDFHDYPHDTSTGRDDPGEEYGLGEEYDPGEEAARKAEEEYWAKVAAQEYEAERKAEEEHFRAQEECWMEEVAYEALLERAEMYVAEAEAAHAAHLEVAEAQAVYEIHLTEEYKAQLVKGMCAEDEAH